jgi:hypothetical protein
MKLTLTSVEQIVLLEILDSHDFLCECSNFPDCEDFKIFQNLKRRVKELPERSNRHSRLGRLVKHESNHA